MDLPLQATAPPDFPLPSHAQSQSDVLSLSLSHSQPLYDPSPGRSHAPPDLYSCTMSGPTAVESSAAAMAVVGSWNHATPRSAHATPNILPAEYDPFAPYHAGPHPHPHPHPHQAYGHPDLYAAEATLPASPVPSGATSQRSSFSSAPASEVFTRNGSLDSYTPRIKMEGGHVDYGPEGGLLLLHTPPPNHPMLMNAATTTFPGSLDVNFYPHPPPLGYAKFEYAPPPSADLPPFSVRHLSSDEGRRSSSLERVSAGANPSGHGPEMRRSSSAVARTRQPRKLTTKEEANFQCQVAGCHKLFGRSYNFKAHLETHDAGREYPFPCGVADCAKRFVRKTDLQRHHQSVHMKQRNHRCDYCSRFFARKDTLRRHMEDGCSKRFDIETVDVMTAARHPAPPHLRHDAYAPPSSTQPGPFLGRTEYLGPTDVPDPMWSG